jgi:UDP-N-acetylmuramoylalanine--D-glutamate ligase
LHAKKAYTNEAVFAKLDEWYKTKTTIYDTVYDLASTHFVWAHNQKNCALVYQVIKENISLLAPDSTCTENDIQQAIGNVYPLKHRMQPVKTIDNIVRYDDGKSTSAQSLGAALESFHEPIVLIAWGSDKWDSFDHLSTLCQGTVSYWVFLWQTAPLFAKMFTTSNIDHMITSSMQECVHKAREEAKKRWAKVILFSPWCASLDMFKNYEDRAEQFMKAVEDIAATY